MTYLIFRFVVGEDGRVGDLVFLKTPPSPCIEWAIRDTLTTWRYQPATLNGKPVDVYLHMTLNWHPHLIE